MRVLLLDIETAPNIAYVWGLWKENIPLARLVDSGYVLCWAAKWAHKDKIMFSSIEQEGAKHMLRRIHKLLNKADVVIHYNGKRFDIPALNKEFLLHDFAPPSNYKQVDLLTFTRSRFKFVSNKLDYVAKALGVGQKVRHKGFELWIECMAHDAQAWKEMEKYNKQDIVILEGVYHKMLPWIKANSSNRGLAKILKDL